MRRGRRTIAGPRERRRIGNGRHAKARMHAQASLFCFRAARIAFASRIKKRRPKAPQIADKPSPSGGFLFFNGVMLKTPMPTQHELEMVTLEELVPKD
ncbi:hypothetical protein, partial [Burkholderia pseudomallei]